MDPSKLTGQTLGGKYRLDQLIGAGGFGAVFAASQQPLGHAVALKVNLQGRPDLRKRFRHEARILSQLNHPNIVRLIDYGAHEHESFGTLLYMVQEFVDGQPLKDVMAATPRLDPALVVELVSQVLDGLESAHQLGIVHRDIKPANLMLTRSHDGAMQVRVLDFGISKIVSSESSLTAYDTRSGQLLGTPAYMAPEQWAGESVSGATDLYAVGILLFRMLSGAAPFEAPSIPALMRAHCDGPIPKLPGAVPPAFNAVIERALAKSPADRFASAGEMRVALRLALAGGLAPPPGPRPRWPFIVAAGALGLLVGAVAIGLSLDETPEASVDEPTTRVVVGAPRDTDPPPPPVDQGAPLTPDATTPAPDAAPARTSARRANRSMRPKRSTPRKTRPKPPDKGPSPAKIAAAFDTALAACRCADAQAQLKALRRVDAPRAAVKERRFEEECQMRLPGNCRTR